MNPNLQQLLCMSISLNKGKKITKQIPTSKHLMQKKESDGSAPNKGDPKTRNNITMEQQ